MVRWWFSPVTTTVSSAIGSPGRGQPVPRASLDKVDLITPLLWSARAPAGGHLILRANLSPQPTDSSEYMAGYQLALGPERQIRNVATVQQMNVVEGGGSQGFYALRLRSAEAVNLGPNASMEVGNEVQSVHGAF